MFKDVELVIVHYRNALPTIVTLNALFKYYPNADITIVDNSNGSSLVDDVVLPYVRFSTDQIRVLRNSSTEGGIGGGLSHGGGLDFALEHSNKKYLLSLESDTMVLSSGALEILTDHVNQGYDWAGAGQKPIGNGFASFTPSFSICRTDLLKAYNLSFKWRPRPDDEYSDEDPLIMHHVLAAEQVKLGLPLTYPEGKPPDTYLRAKDHLIKTELDHVDYFDTGEWIHHFLRRKGYSYKLFKWPTNVCHIWGSRDLALYLTHFREKLPNLDIGDFVPYELRHEIELAAQQLGVD